MFGGVVTKNAFINSLYNVNPHLANSYIGGLNLTYTYCRLTSIPLDLELDVTAAKRFGADDR